MTEKIEGLKNCKCIDQDCLPYLANMTNDNGQSVKVLICPTCSGQIETQDEEE